MSSIGQSIRKGVDMIHGAGEAIRGEALAAADEIAGDKATASKNKDIANKGVNQWDRGYRDQATNTTAHSINTNTTPSASTNNGPHQTNMANKLDPAVDSDMDHRANPASGVSGSVGGTFNPSFWSHTWSASADESEDGQKIQGVAELRGLIGDASDLEPAHKLDPIYEAGGPSMKDGGPHKTHIHRGSISGGSMLEAAEKLDPPDDAEEFETHL